MDLKRVLLFSSIADVTSFAPPPCSDLPTIKTTAAPLTAPSMISSFPPAAVPLSGLTPVMGAPMSAMSSAFGPGLRDIDHMKQVAESIARSGVSALQGLKEKPDSRIRMPFLFEGHALYAEFMAILKMAVERSRKAALAFQQSAPNAFGGGIGRR